MSSPWWVRMARDLTAERSARIREQERAEVAAHVHDSVLHTLTLIQRHVDDPREVARLARAQERELRGWLYRPSPDAAQTSRPPLERAAAEVEDAHGVAIEVVVVGDCPVDERLGALLRRRPGGAGQRGEVRRRRAPVSLYAEVEPEQVDGLRARPRAGLRPRRGARGPARSATVGPRPDGPPRRLAPSYVAARRRHRDPARDAPPRPGARRDRPGEAPSRAAAPVRVVLVDDHRMFRSRRARRARVDDASRWSARPRTSTQAVDGDHGDAARRRAARRAPARRRRPGGAAASWSPSCPT